MESLPWPDEYKKLFVNDGNYYEFAHFGWGDRKTQIGGYCIGYKNAADTLIEDALSSKEISKLDTVVFPALFLYRQYIELTLKDLIISLSELKGNEKIRKFKEYNHDLGQLWKDFSKIHSVLISDNNDPVLDIVKRYIDEFIKIDRTSFSFRYPFTKELKLIFGKEKRINLRHLKERMDEIESFFNGAGDYMHDLTQVRRLG
jgi:hypothetical protein